MNNNNLVVLFLMTFVEDDQRLITFVENYKKFNPGVDHKLVICLKKITSEKILDFKKILAGLDYELFIDEYEKNDFDFGSYRRVAKKYLNSVIFFMNSHSYPIKDFWLKNMYKHFNDKTIIGTTGSCESLLTNFRLSKFYKNLNLYNFFKHYFFLKKNFHIKPNPHFRSANFMMKAVDLIEFTENKTYEKKSDTWLSESGEKGMTNFFKKKNYKILVVNSDGYAFEENDWKNSSTYNFNNQEKLLVMDKHTKRYFSLDEFNKSKMQKKIW